MAIAQPPSPTRSRQDHGRLPTSPMRVYSADHQPIRLLSELESISVPELVHRAVVAYLEQHRDRLSEIAEQARNMVQTGDFEGLARALESSREKRRALRASRLAALSAPPNSEVNSK